MAEIEIISYYQMQQIEKVSSLRRPFKYNNQTHWEYYFHYIQYYTHNLYDEEEYICTNNDDRLTETKYQYKINLNSRISVYLQSYGYIILDGQSVKVLINQRLVIHQLIGKAVIHMQ